MHADFFDEQAEKFFRLFGAFASDDVLEVVGEAGEGGRVRRRVRLCREPAAEVGLLLAERFQADTVGVDAIVTIGGGKLAAFERVVVAVEFAFGAGDVDAAAGERFLELWPVALAALGGIGERLPDELLVAVDGGELGEDGVLKPVLGEPVAVAFAGAVLVAGGAGVVGVAAAVAVRRGADVGAATVVAADEPREQEVGWVAAPQ